MAFSYNYVMNNFCKYSAFYNHIWSWSTRRGVGMSMRSPPTSWKKNYIWGPFPPRGGGLFLHFECIIFSFGVPCFTFWGYFLYVGGGGGGGRLFSTYIEKFLGLFPLPKIGAHALAARVAANISPWGNLREIVRRNLLIHFGTYFYIMLRKSMKWNGVNHAL